MLWDIAPLMLNRSCGPWDGCSYDSKIVAVARQGNGHGVPNILWHNANTGELWF